MCYHCFLEGLKKNWFYHNLNPSWLYNL
jgi:hypothetical protein